MSRFTNLVEMPQAGQAYSQGVGLSVLSMLDAVVSGGPVVDLVFDVDFDYVKNTQIISMAINQQFL